MLARRTFFVMPVFAAGLVAFHPHVFAAIKPSAVSNKVPSGGNLRGPGYLTDAPKATQKAKAVASVSVRVAIALYEDHAQITAENADGVVDVFDARIGGKYAAGQPLSVYLRGAKASSRLVLLAEQGPSAQAIDIDWKTGKLSQTKPVRAKTTVGDLLAAYKMDASDLQGEIALDGKTNLWELER